MVKRLLYELHVNDYDYTLSERVDAQKADKNIVKTIKRSTLIGSINENKMHALTLDLDNDAYLTLDEEGVPTLWLEADTNEVKYRALFKTLKKNNLLRDGIIPSRNKLSLKKRKAAFAKVSKSVYNPNNFWDTCIQLSDHCETSFEDLVEQGKYLTEEPPLLEVSPDALKNPWPLKFKDEIWLVPSSSKKHHHLYVNYLVSWESYKEILCKFKDCNIIEKGYAGASIAHGASFLRRPGYFKFENYDKGDEPDF